ncbi:MAG TPA: PKD domain-containing protein, partial [Verrucomicrobiales bacterium]|nr:PKD domain-containing protein [Verrucomicrobiales bacterium]
MKIRILILCILFILHLQPIRSAEAPDYRFRVEVLTQSIPKPMELEIAPDGRIFYNDIYGSLNIYHPESGKIELAGKLPVFTDQENGFLGFALDPDFSSNHWIYLFYSPIEFSGQHLSRFEMDGDRLDFDTEKVILKFEDQRERCCHHAGSVEFGPNGNLFISTGDNTDPGADTAGYAPIDERPGKHPVDAQKSSANTHDLRGKILRIRPLSDGTYQIPNGNLFPEDGSSGRPEIFVMGCRNPWRMSVDEKTGIVYWGEVGPDAGTTSARGSRGYDEINQARTAGNYGWPYFVGNNFAYADYDFATKEIGPLYDPQRPINESPNNTGNRILPPAQAALIYWPYADSPEFPSLGSGGRTACAGPVFHYRPEFAESNGFPQHFDNCLLFWDWQRPFMKWARLDSNSKLESIEDFTHAVVLSNDSGQSSSGGKSNRFLIQRPVDALFGPDGCLYMLDYGKTWGSNQDSQLIKISYIRGNLPPVAIASASQSFGREPLAVHFTSTGSLDYESDSVSYEWSLHPGGKTFSTSPNADMKIDQPGNYVVSLKVSDQEGLSSTVQVPVTVGNSRPKVVFKSPKEGDFFEPGVLYLENTGSCSTPLFLTEPSSIKPDNTEISTSG